MGDRLAVPIRYYALAGIAAAILLNVLLRGVVRFGGLPASLLIAALVAGGLAWWFARAQRRWPTWAWRSCCSSRSATSRAAAGNAWGETWSAPNASST